MTGEIRAIAADPMWLSTTAGRACVVVHFTCRPETEGVLAVLA